MSTTNEPFVPERPVERLLGLLDALLAEKRWYEPMFALRYAASSLVTVPGEPAAIAAALRDTSEALRRASGWFSPLRTEVRHVMSAMLLRTGLGAEAFVAEIERLEEHFKTERLPRGRTHGHLAALLLIERARRDGRVVGADDVARVAAIHGEMKRRHRFLTGMDDLPAAALLSGLDRAPSEIAERCEVFYDGLRDLGFSRGNQLQLVSHLLLLAPGDDRVLMGRFRALYDAFDDTGLWMNSGDYDEVACLSFLDETPGRVVAVVADHRERLRAHKPRPERQLSFSLACSTAFLELAGGDRSAMRDAQHVMATYAVIVAQQAAMTAAAVSASSAAAASSSSS